MKNYEVKVETVTKLEDKNYHLLEWSLPSFGGNKNEAVFNAASTRFDFERSQFVNLDNADFSAKFDTREVISVVSIKVKKPLWDVVPWDGLKVRSVRICAQEKK